MGARVPPVDSRGYDELLRATRIAIAHELGLLLPLAAPASNATSPVPGDALVRIFARLSEIVVEHLNRVPEKNRLAFLSLLGTAQQPPRPARVPLTFALDAGAGSVRVPAGSAVAAVAIDSEADPPVFETERALTVTPTTPFAAYVREPARDRYSRVDAVLADSDAAVSLFEGQTPIAHELFVGDERFALAQQKDVTLRIGPLDPAAPWPSTLAWSFYDGSRYSALDAPVVAAEAQTGTWRVTFATLPPVAPCVVGEQRRPWLRAALRTPLPPAPDPRPRDVNAPIAHAGLIPDSAAAGAAVVDPWAAFAPFGSGPAPVPFAFACERAFTKPGATVALTIAVDAPPQHTVLSAVALSWEAAGRGPIVPLTSTADQLHAFLHGGTIDFVVPSGWQETTIAGIGARWLRVSVTDGSFGAGAAPRVARLTVGYTWPQPVISTLTAEVTIARSGLAPDAAVCNLRRVELNDDIQPFGPTPAVGDAFYVACDEALSLPAATITLTMTGKPVGVTGKPAVAWEVFDEANTRWGPATTSDGHGAVDGTHALTFASGAPATVRLTTPHEPARVEVSGDKRFWLRARLLSGDYGHGIEVDGEKVVPATWDPPQIHTLTIGYELASAAAVDGVVTRNDGETAAPTMSVHAPLAPFTPGDDRCPTFYLGTDGTFENATASLFFDVEPPRYRHSLGPQTDDVAPPTVLWEYRGPGGWRALGVRDETRGLSRRGLVSFIAPPDMHRATAFGVSAYWLRARWEGGGGHASPLLAQVRANTTWASNVTTVRAEILGSGTGAEAQRFRLAHAPVIAGEQIEVRERGPLAGAPSPAVVPVQIGDDVEPAAAGAEDWVRWEAVVDFYGSGPRSRHYVIDRLSGEIRFGDGRRGLPPPEGRANIRATCYRTGGGAAGNRPAAAITELRSAVAPIDGVTNPVAAAGGADAQPLADVRERGARVLRHGDRAVTASDVEDLALAASPDVARAHVVDSRRRGNAGEIGVVVVPASPDRPPVPTLELLDTVRRFLRRRLPATAALWVAGPGWLRIAVQAEVVPARIEEETDTRDTVRSQLDAFLDPLSGSFQPPARFGRVPRRSDLLAVIHAVAGVDHVRRLTMTRTVVEPAPVAGVQLVFAGDHTITLTSVAGEARA